METLLNYRFLWFAACFLAVGCASPDPAAQPHVFEPLPLWNPNFRQGSHIAVRVAARAGHETALDDWLSLRRDCSLANYFRVRVVFPPKHGVVAVRTGKFRPYYPEDTYRHDCNLQPHDGIGAFYQPAPGYVGPDELTLTIDTPGGKSWSEDFTIDTR